MSKNGVLHQQRNGRRKREQCRPDTKREGARVEEHGPRTVPSKYRAKQPPPSKAEIKAERKLRRLAREAEREQVRAALLANGPASAYAP